MAMQEADLESRKEIRLYNNKQAVLAVSIRFVNALGWKRFQSLFLIRTGDNRLIITDEKNFVKIRLNENSRVFKARLSGSKSTKNAFNHRVMLSRELFDLMDLHKNGTVVMRMEDNDKLVVSGTNGC